IVDEVESGISTDQNGNPVINIYREGQVDDLPLDDNDLQRLLTFFKDNNLIDEDYASLYKNFPKDFPISNMLVIYPGVVPEEDDLYNRIEDAILQVSDELFKDMFLSPDNTCRIGGSYVIILSDKPMGDYASLTAQNYKLSDDLMIKAIVLNADRIGNKSITGSDGEGDFTEYINKSISLGLEAMFIEHLASSALFYEGGCISQYLQASELTQVYFENPELSDEIDLNIIQSEFYFAFVQAAKNLDYDEFARRYSNAHRKQPPYMSRDFYDNYINTAVGDAYEIIADQDKKYMENIFPSEGPISKENVINLLLIAGAITVAAAPIAGGIYVKRRRDLRKQSYTEAQMGEQVNNYMAAIYNLQNSTPNESSLGIVDVIDYIEGMMSIQQSFNFNERQFREAAIKGNLADSYANFYSAQGQAAYVSRLVHKARQKVNTYDQDSVNAWNDQVSKIPEETRQAFGIEYIRINNQKIVNPISSISGFDNADPDSALGVVTEQTGITDFIGGLDKELLVVMRAAGKPGGLRSFWGRGEIRTNRFDLYGDGKTEQYILHNKVVITVDEDGKLSFSNPEQ
ncbi:hypothetical protein KC678_05460, partial [Candidatus Dojkabacteria bacterium]|nr:hypothetical protein [Candidatus Dojkabacteria bacterium]